MTMSSAVSLIGSLVALASFSAGCADGTTAIQVDADDSGCRMNPTQARAGDLLDFTVTNKGAKPTSFSLRQGEHTLLQSGPIEPNKTWRQARVQLTTDNPGDVTAVCEPDLRAPGVPVDFTLTD